MVAWGDGREPYLAAADADARCTVEEEGPREFSFEALLESKNVKLRSRTAAGITIAIGADAEAKSSADPEARCIGSLEALIRLDAATFFPVHAEIKAVGSGCEQTLAVTDHYDNQGPMRAKNTFRKGATREFDYVLQRSKAGKMENDFRRCACIGAPVNPLCRIR